MPSEKKSRDRTREREKDRKIRDATNDRLEKSSSDKYNDRKTSSRTKDSSRSNREKDRDRDKKREQRDRGDKKEEKEKERHKKKEEKVTLNHETERKALKHHNNKENEKRRSSTKQHRTEIVTEDSDISEENIKQENITTTKTVIEDDFNYEDDEFEDYDEDFEDDDDDEEDEEEEESDDVAQTESKLDSGNYDVQPSRQTSVRMQRELEAVKEAMVRENMGPKSSKQTSEMSDDSGRESPAVRQTKREEPRKQSGFINFSAAKERNKVQIAAKAANSRGADLQKMIRLDIVNFDLLDLPPIRYSVQILQK